MGLLSEKCYNVFTPMQNRQYKRKSIGLTDQKGKEIREGDVVIMEGFKGLLGIVEYQAPHCGLYLSFALSVPEFCAV